MSKVHVTIPTPLQVQGILGILSSIREHRKKVGKQRRLPCGHLIPNSIYILN